MTLDEVLARLVALGTEAQRALLVRQGCPAPLFGVSPARLEKLRADILRDHALALQLWASRHHEARLLAAQVADPAATTAPQLDAWARDAATAPLADAVAALAARSPFGRRCADAWTASKAEATAAVGWCVVARLAGSDPHLSDEDLEAWLQDIERCIRRAPDRVRPPMSRALLAIGMRHPKLAALALAASARIGPQATPAAARPVARRG